MEKVTQARSTGLASARAAAEAAAASEEAPAICRIVRPVELPARLCEQPLGTLAEDRRFCRSNFASGLATVVTYQDVPDEA